MLIFSDGACELQSISKFSSVNNNEYLLVKIKTIEAAVYDNKVI